MTYELGIGVIPIPDGVQADGRLLRLSLVLEVSPGMSTVADLADWPAALARAAGASASSPAGPGLVVSFLDANGQPLAGFETITPELPAAARLATAAAGARATWRRLFPGPQLDALYAALSAPETREAGAPAPEQARHYRAGAIAAAATQLREGAIGPTVRARALALELASGKHKKLSARTVARIAENARAPFRFLFERTLLDALARPFDGLSKVAPRYTLNLGKGARETVDIAGLNRRVQQARVDQALRKAGSGMAAPGDTVERALRTLTEISGTVREQLLDVLLLGVHLGAPRRGEFDLHGASDEEAERGIGVALAIDLAQKVEEFASTFGDVRGDPRAAGAAACAHGAAAGTEAAFREAVHEKYTGLRARPAMAKLLNMLLDVTVPDSAALPERGFVRVSFVGDARLPDLPLVGYRLERRGDGGASAFRPATRDEANGKRADQSAPQRALPLEDGMVQLRDRRFRLSVTDVHSLINASRVKLGEHRAAQQGGADQRELSPRMMEERGRGIQLLDDGGLESLMANLAASAGTHTLFAEDLVIGYRAFVRRSVPGEPAPRAWRPLMARSVSYPDVRRVYRARRGEAGPDWHPYSDAPEREHGYVRPMPRMQGAGADSGAVAPSHICTWAGASLGLPAANPAGPSTELSCEDSAAEHLHIGAGVTYRHPDGAAYRMPALRLGSGYEFGLAPVYLHGGGPTLDQAAKALDRNSRLVLGSYGNDEPFTFRHPGDVQAPVVLLSPDDRLVSGTPTPRNEHVERIVLRSGARENTVQVTRFLAPPRVDFGGAEQFGVFDRLDHQPGGAFTGYRRDARGDFHSVESPARKGDGAPEQLYVLAPGAAPRGAPPYFPDPLARNVSLAFERNEEIARGFPDLLPPLAFWPVNAGDPHAGSQQADVLRLDFVRWQDAREGGRVSPDEVGRRTAVTLQIAPAEEVNLWLWCWPDLRQLFAARPQLIWPLARAIQLSETALAERWSALAGKAVVPASVDPVREYGMEPQLYAKARGLELYFRGIARAAADTGAASERAALVRATEQLLFQMLPLNGVTGWRKLALVHAVDKPLAVPSIIGDALKPIRLVAGVTMQERAAAGAPTDMIGGTTLFFTGAIAFHRASTGALRLEANWPNLDPAVAVVDIAPPGAARPHYVDRPPRVDRILFDVRDIPRAHGANAEGSFDLLRDELGRYRELKAGSDTTGPSATAARRMSLRLVGTSRFVNDFASQTPEPTPGALGKFEVESRRLRTGGPQPAPLPGEVFYEVILQATARPPVPVVSRIDWIAPEQRLRSGDSHLVVRKNFYPRLYLDNSYRVSGEDELFAVTFLPAGVLEERAYQAGAEPTVPDATAALDGRYADEFARFGIAPDGSVTLPAEVCQPADASPLCGTVGPESLRMVTRWGADPTAAPMGRLEALMSPERFHGHVAAVAAVPMPVPDTSPDDKGVQPMVTVGALLYRPRLEAHTGRWYIDIGIDPGAAHAPFVRLSIARYQPLALKTPIDLRMSAPLLLDPFRVPAARTVEVRHAPGQPIAVSVYGVGYVRREPYGVADAVRHLTDTPLQNMELMRVSQTEPPALLQAYDSQGVALRRSAVRPVRAGPALHWREEFDVPEDPRGQRYALVIDEVDMHIPDRVIDAVALDKRKPNQDAPIAKSPRDLVARPGFFSLTIELRAFHHRTPLLEQENAFATKTDSQRAGHAQAEFPQHGRRPGDGQCRSDTRVQLPGLVAGH